MIRKLRIVSAVAILSLLMFALVPVQNAKAIPVVWQDDFENDQDFHLWSWTTVSNGCLLETTTVNPHQGVFAAHSITQLYGDRAYSAIDFNGYGPAYGLDSIYVRGYFRLDQLNLPSDQTWIDLIDIVGGPIGADAGTYSTSVRVENNLGTINWALATIENNLTTWTYGTHTIQTGQYYFVETLRDVANGIQMLWIDGQLEVSTTTAMTHPSWEAQVGIVWEGRSANQTVGICELRYDDVIVSDHRIPQTSVFYVDIDGNSYPVSIVSNSSITDFGFSQANKTIGFNVTGTPGTTGFSNITFPTQLMGGPYVTLIDGLPVLATVTSNATNTSIYLISSPSGQVETIGTTVVPEFPTIIAIMLILTAMTLMLFATKKSLTQHKAPSL